MKIYMASRYSRKLELREYAKQARQAGITVTSRWLDEPNDPNGHLNDSDVDTIRFYADQDIEDIVHCDALVFFSEDPKIGTPRGGRHVEFGIALANHIPIAVVGEPENVFHYASDIDIEFYDTFENALEYIKTL